MYRVVHLIAAQQFQFLDANGRKHDNGRYFFRFTGIGLQRHASAHAVGNVMGLVYAQRVQHGIQIHRVRVDGVIRDPCG